jgi:hypothetical protein
MTSRRGLSELRTDAGFHRERLERYRAEAGGLGPSSPVQLRELELACVFAEARLRRAEQAHEAEARRRLALTELTIAVPEQQRAQLRGR